VSAIRQAQQEGFLSFVESESMQSLILRLRGSLGGLYDNAFQPVPFMYFNMAHWLVTIYLPFFNMAIAQLVDKVALSFFIVFLANACFVGLLEIAVQMLYPYGIDSSDLAVFHFINFTAVNSLAMLDYDADLPDEDEHQEEYLSYKPEGAYAVSAAAMEANLANLETLDSGSRNQAPET
jgi:predicted membrane chloride channel (bestrophin family)